MIVALVGQKGGVGKSTLAICLGVAAFQRGRSTLLVDADPQGTLRTWSEVAAERRRLGPNVMAMGSLMHRPGELDAVARYYDWTFIDCPPSHGEVQRSALMVAHIALLPCGPSASDIWALSSSLELVRAARTLRPGLRAAVVVTRKQSRTSLGRDVRSVLQQSGFPVLNSEMAYRVAYQEALALGGGVTDRKNDPAAHEVRAMFDEVEKFAYAPQEASGGYSTQAAASA
jgi:chromosome partitioning protein